MPGKVGRSQDGRRPPRSSARYEALAVAGLADGGACTLSPKRCGDRPSPNCHLAWTAGLARNRARGWQRAQGWVVALVPLNGHYRLAMRADGNVVLYWEGHPLWASNTAKHPGAFLEMQADGDLVVYQGNRPIWELRNRPRGQCPLLPEPPGQRQRRHLLARPKADLGDGHRRRRSANRARGRHRAQGWVVARVVERRLPARDAGRRQPRPLLGRAADVGLQHGQAPRRLPGDAGRRRPRRLSGQPADLELVIRPRGQCALLPEPAGRRQRHHLLARPKADLGDEHRHRHRAPAR